MIVFCASDLLWATKIKSTADALHIPCRPVRNLETLEARLADTPGGVKALIVDLEAGEAGLELIRRVRQEGKQASTDGKPLHVLAFGPHVAVHAMRAAKASGADAVMARGAFSARLPQILRDLSGGAAPEDHLEE